jgi:hypothetical protein
MKNAPLAGIALLTLATFSTANADTVVFDQSTYALIPNTAADRLQADSTSEEIADDFSLAAGGTISSIKWYGSDANWPGFGGVDLGFRIRVYADNSGMPSSSVVYDALTGSLFPAATTGIGDFPARYEFAPTGLSLASGTTYWLSIEEVVNAIYPWGWSVSTTGVGGNLGVVYRVTDTDPFQTSAFTSGTDMAFTLSVATVPVPAAAWLFGSAVGLMGVLRRKPATA